MLPVTDMPQTKSAIVLFGHGARSANWAIPFQRLQTILKTRLPEHEIGLAFLEFMTPNLPDLVRGFVQQGIQSIQVTPIFIGQGGHVLKDLPLLIEQLRLEFPQLELKLVAAAGEDDLVLQSIADYCVRAMEIPSTIRT
jgi:sirohydrochlorin cobaltochelatase